MEIERREEDRKGRGLKGKIEWREKREWKKERMEIGR